MRRSFGRSVLAAGVLAFGLCAGAAENAQQPAAGTPGVLCLERTPDFKLQGEQVLLVRELVRQSLLIAARDELGLLTRDFWLGEAMPAVGAHEPLDLIVQPGKPDRIDLCRGSGSTRRKVAQWEFNPAHRMQYGELSQELEKLSRTKFVELLEKAGFRGRRNAWEPETPLADETQRLLGEMTFSSQFLAVRQIHAAVRSQGESAALLAGLVRGYANLGVLTEFHWHPAHKAFKARALLYAQRLTQRRVRPLWTTCHRAYAYALAGLHAPAIKELEDAEKQFRTSPAGNITERPTWAEALNAYCRYRMDQVDPGNVDPADEQLLLLLEYLDAEASGNVRVGIETGMRALEKMPECYRIHDGLARLAGVTDEYPDPHGGLLVVEQKLFPRLEGMADLPVSVRQAMQIRAEAGGLLQDLLGAQQTGRHAEFAARARVTEALLAAGAAEASPPAKPQPAAEATAEAAGVDRAEFSWSILGHMLRELSFAQVWQKAYFGYHGRNSGEQQFLDNSTPLVQSHPYRIAIGALTRDVAARQKALDQWCRLQPDSVEFTAYPMWNELWYYNHARCHHWFKQALANADDTVRDLDLAFKVFYATPLRTARVMWIVSPHNPNAQAVLIREDWKRVEKVAAGWEKDNHPVVLKALGEHYTKESRWDDAARCLWGAIKQAPDEDSYLALADVYDRQGNEEKWLLTLESYLQLHHEHGMNHALMDEKIAIHFAERGQWEKALSFARAAVGGHPSRELPLAGGCEEVLQDWNEAEACFKAVSERHSRMQLAWYFFCKRTGRGDLPAATQLARRFAERPHDRGDGETLGLVSDFYLLEHDLKKALAGYAEVFAAMPNPFYGMHVALIADELKDVKTRDAALERIKTQGSHYQSRRTKKPRWELIALAELIAKDLVAGGKGKIDPAAIEKLRAGGDAVDRLCLDCFVGWYSDLHGRGDEAVRAWKRGVACTTASNVHEFLVYDVMRTFCGAGLLRHAVKPEDYKDLLRKIPETHKNGEKASGEKDAKKCPLPAGTGGPKSPGSSAQAHSP